MYCGTLTSSAAYTSVKEIGRSQVEATNYSQLHLTKGYPTKYWTMQELFDFAFKNSHVNYMFWQHLPTPAAPDAYCWLDAPPIISANPTFNSISPGNSGLLRLQRGLWRSAALSAGPSCPVSCQ